MTEQFDLFGGSKRLREKKKKDEQLALFGAADSDDWGKHGNLIRDQRGVLVQ